MPYYLGDNPRRLSGGLPNPTAKLERGIRCKQRQVTTLARAVALTFSSHE